MGEAGERTDVAASEADWRAEYLDAIIAARVVDGLDAAIAHAAGLAPWFEFPDESRPCSG